MQYNYKGRYDSTLSYAKKDVVSYQPTTSDPTKYYFCLSANDSLDPQTPSASGDTLYWAVLNANSNFPNTVDTFLIREDIQSSDTTDVDRYQELKLKSNRTSSEDTELSNLEDKLRTKLIHTEDWNKLQQSIQNMQMYLKDSVEGYIDQKQSEFNTKVDTTYNEFSAKVEKFDDKGVYDSTVTYMKNNFVTFNKQTYICTVDSTVNIEPTNTSNWRLVAAQGDRGETGYGVGLSPKGQYYTSTQYYIDDLVLYEGNQYRCIANSLGNYPTDSNYWELFISGYGENLQDLTTTDKSGLVNAINEVNTKTNTNSTNIGVLNTLSTTAKDSLVNAINEVKESSAKMDWDLYREVSYLQLEYLTRFGKKLDGGVTIGDNIDSSVAYGITADLAKTKATQSLAAGETILAGVDANGNQTSKITNASDALNFKVGQEVTVLDDVASEELSVTRAESLQNTTTNTISDATVASSAYQTNKNARPMMLENGDLVFAELDTTVSPNAIRLQKRDINGTISDLCYFQYSSTTYEFQSFSISSKDNLVYVLGAFTNGDAFVWTVDAETQNNVNRFSDGGVTIETGQSSFDSCSLAISPDRTTLLASFATKNSTYGNNFNVRSVTGTINSDNTVSWGTVQQQTTRNYSGEEGFTDVVSTYDINGNPFIFSKLYSSNYIIVVLKPNEPNQGTANGAVTGDANCWNNDVYSSSYAQDSPDAVTDKNGVLLCAWHGMDSTDTTYNNIRFSKSTDGGATWSAMTKLTSGNSVHQGYGGTSITVDKNNNYYVLWDGVSGSYYQIRMIKFDGTSWGAITDLTSSTTGNQQYPSTLYDNTFAFDYSSPLHIWKDSANSDVSFSGTWNVIKEQFYLEVSALANSYKKDALIARTTANYDTVNNRIEVGGWQYDTNYTRTDVSVVASADTTSASSRPHMLSNGWLVSSVSVGDTVNGTTGSGVEIHLSKDEGATWSMVAYFQTTTTTGVTDLQSITTKGNVVYLFLAGGASLYANSFDAEKFTGTPIDLASGYVTVDTQNEIDSVNLTIDQNGVLYGVASTKNGTYPNSFNARYYKSSDGGSTWTAEQVTTNNTSGSNFWNCRIFLDSSGVPQIASKWNDDRIIYLRRDNSLEIGSVVSNTWTFKKVYEATGYAQSSPDAIFIPSTVSQSGSDEIHVSWHGTDSTNTADEQIRTAISKDGGGTWTVSKLTSTGKNYYSSITANNSGELFILYTRFDGTNKHVDKLTNLNGTWSSPSLVTSTAGTFNFPSSLFDNTFSLKFSEPLFIYKDDIKVGFYGTFTTSSVQKLLNSTIRYNVNSQTNECVLWALRDAGLTVNAEMNGIAMSKQTNSDGTEDQFSHSLSTVQDVEIKLDLSRTSTSDDVGVSRILGGIA